MSHRITPAEIDGWHTPTIWDKVVETFKELEEEADVPDPYEIRLMDSMREAA